MKFVVGDSDTSSFAEDLVAHVMVGQLLAWFRQSEMSADRAGLVCIDGDLKTAQQALLRLQHGTKEDVDPKIAAQEIVAFEKLPFVKIVRKIRSFRTTHPYISDRCLALKDWTSTDQYIALMQRTTTKPPKAQLVIEEIKVTGLPDTDFGFGTASDPIIKAAIGKKEFKSGEFSNNNNPELTDLAWSAPYVPNTRIVLEVLDYDGASGNDFIGACLLPIRAAKSGVMKVQLRRDIKEQSSVVNLPTVEVKFRVK